MGNRPKGSRNLLNDKMNKVERSSERSSSSDESDSDSDIAGIDHTYNPYKFKNLEKALFDKKVKPKTQNFVEDESNKKEMSPNS